MIAHSSDVRRYIGLKVLTTLMQHAVCCCTPQTIWCLSLLPRWGGFPQVSSERAPDGCIELLKPRLTMRPRREQHLC